MQYSIGIDYGTQSGRVVLLDLTTANELAVSVVPYAHGVIDQVLPGTAVKLPLGSALQHPLDYIEVLEKGIPDVLKRSGADSTAIIGIGVDFTSCTVLPVTSDGQPLCLSAEWQNRPHAWPKLWKHHTAQYIADRMNQIAEKRREPFLARYGGRISSEWYFPKLIEVFEEDREVYQACASFIEATDWIVWYLTGEEKRNSCTAGYKALWSETSGLPSSDYFKEVNPEFQNPGEKLGHLFYPLGTKAGTLRAELAQKLGLRPDVAVAVGNVDAMVAVPSVGVHGSGALVMVMGTSICHLTVNEHEIQLPGITGVVKDGALPGLYGYEAGQAAVGDMFEWFVNKSVPAVYHEKARVAGKPIYEYLEELASLQQAGATGLIAFDWWNGNRSILGDANLSGVIFGLTLATKTEDIYRALLESTAYGTRRIVDNFVNHNIPLNTLVACGGIAQKSPLLMQIYADVCGLPVVVRGSTEIPARGSAMFGAVAAGKAKGGFDSIAKASEHLAPPILKVYEPNLDNHKIYSEVYEIYCKLYDFMGSERVDLLHRLKNVRLKSAI